MMNEIDVFYTNREIKKTNTYRGDYQHNNLYCVLFKSETQTVLQKEEYK